MLKKLGGSVATLLAVGALLFGANEAYAASNAITVANCPGQYNWCAASLGGPDNCTECCQNSQYLNGFCFSQKRRKTSTVFATDQGWPIVSAAEPLWRTIT